MKALRTIYFIALNTALLIIAIEFGTHVAILLLRQGPPATRFEELQAFVQRNYAHMRPAEVEDLLRVNAALRFRYAVSGSMVHDAVTSRFINIDGYGVRSNGRMRPTAAAMQESLWMFGGSTTFGSGIADGETIPAQLERLLGRAVINFGVRGEGSLMENRLLSYYLRLGYRPALAIFLDGINESCQSDAFGDQLTELVARSQRGYQWTFGMPVTYAYDAIRKRVRTVMRAAEAPDRLEFTCIDRSMRSPLRVIHARTLDERAALCRLYGIVCQTIVQPFPTLHGRHDDVAFVATGNAAHLRALFSELEGNWRAAGATFVTDALDHHDRHPFIDEIHYSADASRLIAMAVARTLATR